MAENALVGSRLDYCNSLFRGLCTLDLCKLQCVQNNLARIVDSTTKYSHITPARKVLQCLLIKYSSIFKTAVHVYKFLHRGNHKYFEPFLIPRHSAYNTKVNLMACFLRPPTLLQLSSLYYGPFLQTPISCLHFTLDDQG